MILLVLYVLFLPLLVVPWILLICLSEKWSTSTMCLLACVMSFIAWLTIR